MSLFDSIKDERADKAQRSKQCLTCKWLDKQGPEDIEAFDAYIASGEPLSLLLKACARNGLDCGDESFRRHVKRHHNDAG